LFILGACFFAACKSDPPYDSNTQLQIEVDSIQKKLTADELVFTKTSEGLFYQIIDPGEADSIAPILTDSVTIHFAGRFFFKPTVLYDSTRTNVDTLSTKFVLANAIRGWQLGIPLIKHGGRIRLIVPSPLAYQNRVVSGAVVVPANSILDFEIRLIKVKKPVTTK